MSKIKYLGVKTRKLRSLRPHPSHKLIPRMKEDEWRPFLDDVKRRGILQAITINKKGQILDGMNRVRAGKVAGIERARAEVVAMSEVEERLFVIRAALLRRHLNDDQRGMLAAMFRTQLQEVLPDSRTDRRQALGKLFNVSTTKVMQAVNVQRRVPELARRVLHGDVRLSTALRAVKEEYGLGGRRLPAALKAGAKLVGQNAAKGGVVVTGDFREVLQRLGDGAVDLIFTDPPYEDLEAYRDLGELAARVLKPGGHLVAYVSHNGILEAGRALGKHLTFSWTFAARALGRVPFIRDRMVFMRWHPLLWFCKGRISPVRPAYDLFEGQTVKKEYHRWQKGDREAGYFISRMTDPGGLVLDPFCGSGTTCVAAIKLGRLCIGVEKNAKISETARWRVRTALRVFTACHPGALKRDVSDILGGGGGSDQANGDRGLAA